MEELKYLPRHLEKMVWNFKMAENKKIESDIKKN